MYLCWFVCMCSLLGLLVTSKMLTCSILIFLAVLFLGLAEEGAQIKGRAVTILSTRLLGKNISPEKSNKLEIVGGRGFPSSLSWWVLHIHQDSRELILLLPWCNCTDEGSWSWASRWCSCWVFLNRADYTVKADEASELYTVNTSVMFQQQTVLLNQSKPYLVLATHSLPTTRPAFLHTLTSIQEAQHASSFRHPMIISEDSPNRTLREFLNFRENSS